MSITTPEPTPTPTPAPAQNPTPTPTPTPPPAPAEPRTFTQAELDQIIKKRLEKFQDYDDVKAKAVKFDEAEEAAKTEAQKQAEAIAKLAAENESLKVANLRSAVAEAKGVPAALLTGSTQADIEASADALVAFRGAAAPPNPSTAHAAGAVGSLVDDIDAQIAEAEKARNFTLAIALKQRKYANKP